MQQKSSKTSVDNITTEKNNTADIAPVEEARMRYADLKKCVDKFYNDVTDFETREAYKQGYSCAVGEDLSNIDLLCNIYDIIYNHCMTADISTFEKRNLKNICTGIQQINKGLTQYNDKGLDSILISTLLGYLLKITRNYFHD
jgi:hypothetical protein